MPLEELEGKLEAMLEEIHELIRKRQRADVTFFIRWDRTGEPRFRVDVRKLDV